MVFLRVLNAAQAALAAYGAYNSYIAIRNLQGYEETSKKAAGWSKAAAYELQKTRTTQTSGAVAILASLITATVLAASGPSLPFYVGAFASPVMMVGVWAARSHIKTYWSPGDGKTVGMKVPMPGMADYNEAERKTEELLMVMEYLEYSWVATSLVGAIGGY